MFVFQRPALAVIVALIAAWLLPHAADRLFNGTAPSAPVAAVGESTDLRVANRP
jgi:hypothetical protein